MTSVVQQNCLIIELLTEKTWGRFWERVQNGVTLHSFHEEEIGELLAKNIERTARRQRHRQHLLFREY